MKELTLIRSDFKYSQDYPNESFFDWALSQLGIPKEKRGDIGEVTIKDIMADNIETS